MSYFVTELILLGYSPAFAWNVSVRTSIPISWNDGC